MSLWLWFVIGLAAAASLGLLALAFRRPEADDPEWQRAYDRMEANAAVDPTRAWAAAAFRLVTRNFDPAYRPHWAREVVAASYGFTDAASLEATLAPLEAGDDAWDLVRALTVLRMAVGCGLLADAESGRRVGPVCARLRARYDGWSAMADAYLAGRRADLGLAADGHQDDARFAEIDETRQTLADEVWPQVPWAG